MSGIATFDYGLWSTRYPELVATTNAATAAEYFLDATDILDNTAASPVADPVKRLRLLNILVAHFAALANAAANGGGLAGPVSSATEGSVTVTAMVKVPSGAEFFYTTAYGRQYWLATAFLRTARYVPGITRRSIRCP